MKYYLHSSNSFSDEKIHLLFMRFGYEGLGLFYTALEQFALHEKPINTEVLKHQLGVGKRLEKCWKFMEEIGILSSNNGETFNENLLKFSEKYQIKNQKNRERVAQHRKNKGLSENVMRYNGVRNAPKDKLSKDNIIDIGERSLESITKTKKEPAAFPEIPDSLKAIPGFIEIWESFLLNRKQMKKQVTGEAAKRLLQKLQTLIDPVSELSRSIERNWQGLFPEYRNIKPSYDYSDALHPILRFIHGETIALRTLIPLTQEQCEKATAKYGNQAIELIRAAEKWLITQEVGKIKNMYDAMVESKKVTQ